MTVNDAFVPSPQPGDLERVAASQAASFRRDARGRMLVQNAPDHGVAPLLALSGCGHGNRLLLRHDVPDALAGRIERLAASEPPLQRAGQATLHQRAYLEILSEAFTDPQSRSSLDFVLPQRLPVPTGTQLVRSREAAGVELRERFARDGMPADLFALGFVDVHELWEPWCAVMKDGAIAALAFAARLGTHAAQLGLISVPAWRSRGLGAAATAGWTHHTALADHQLFYSCSLENRSSQRVVQRLGLRLLGATFTVVAPPSS
jgi:hypothetical protein